MCLNCEEYESLENRKVIVKGVSPQNYYRNWEMKGSVSPLKSILPYPSGLFSVKMFLKGMLKIKSP